MDPNQIRALKRTLKENEKLNLSMKYQTEAGNEDDNVSQHVISAMDRGNLFNRLAAVETQDAHDGNMSLYQCIKANRGQWYQCREYAYNMVLSIMQELPPMLIFKLKMKNLLDSQ